MDAMPSISPFGDHSNGTSPSGMFPSPYVRRLSLAEVGCGRQEGAYHPCPFDMFVRAGMPLAECVLLSEAAHREFMDQSGLKEDLLAPFRHSGVFASASIAMRMRLSHRSSPIDGELNRQICEALIGFGSPSVAVVSEGLIERRLRSIPEVKDAIREAWLSLEGLGRQLEAASRGEVIPTWPVSILAENASG